MKFTWHIERRMIQDLKDYHKNPRKITKDQLNHIKKSIEKFGFIDMPVVNLDNTIIAGHQRIKILKRQGWEEIQVQVPDRLLSEKEVEELNFRHNNNHGYNDDDILANQYDMEELKDWGYEYLQDTEQKDEKKKKPRVEFEFDSQDELHEFVEEIEANVKTTFAKMKVKV